MQYSNKQKTTLAHQASSWSEPVRDRSNISIFNPCSILPLGCPYPFSNLSTNLSCISLPGLSRPPPHLNSRILKEYMHTYECCKIPLSAFYSLCVWTPVAKELYSTTDHGSGCG